MDKSYPTTEISSAWLAEIGSDSTIDGIKNIIGIPVMHNGERLYYSILDDCFFRVMPPMKKLADNLDEYSNRIFVEVYKDKSVGLRLFRVLHKSLVTKKDIIDNKELITGHYVDFDGELSLETSVDYEDEPSIDSHIIDSVDEYRMKLGKPVACDEFGLCGPVKKKMPKS